MKIAGQQAGVGVACKVSDADVRPHSHSIVAGGLPLMS